DARWQADGGQETASRMEVAKRIAAHDAAHWERAFTGKDVCCSIVCSMEEAVRDPHFAARGLFARTLRQGEHAIPALPVPIAERLRGAADDAGYPALGEANSLLDGKR